MFATVALLAAVTVLFLVYRALRLRRLYWLHRRIPFASWPHLVFGNVRGIWSREHSSAVLQKLYSEFKERRLAAGGFNVFLRPAILVVDPELVGKVLVEDADVFSERGLYVNVRDDPLSGTLFCCGGDEWKELRRKMSGMVSRESVKGMFGLVAAVAEELRVEVLRTIDRCRLDIHDLAERYTTDAIGASVFGIRCGTIHSSSNEFREMGLKVQNFSLRTLFVHWIGESFPKFARYFKLRVTDSCIEQFFTGLCRATVLHRESYGFMKDDLLQLLIRLRRNKQLSMEELSTLCYSFIKDGLGTCSSLITFCLYELAMNPTIQSRLRKEINHSLEDSDGQLTHEIIQSMTYLDQIINETLRKYPPVDYLIRRSRRTYNQIPEGTLFVIPTYALHHDPDHFLQPDLFNPERFALKEKRQPFSYVPFGAGPRSCIGLNYGLLLVKTGIVTLVRSFRFTSGDDTVGGVVRFKPNSRVLSLREGSVSGIKIERI